MEAINAILNPAVDKKYLLRLHNFFTYSVGEKFNLYDNVEPKYWYDSAHKERKIETIPIEDMDKFISHVKHYIDLKHPDFPQVEFDEEFKRLKVLHSITEDADSQRWMGLTEKQRGL